MSVDSSSRRVSMSRYSSCTSLIFIALLKKTLSIFDAANFREIAVMHDLGETPAQVVVPPSH